MKGIKDGKAPVDEGTRSTALQDDSKKEVDQSENPKKNFATPKNKEKAIKNKGPQKLQHRLQRRMKNLPGMFIYLMITTFYVLTMDIWLGIVKFLTGTITIYKTLEEVCRITRQVP